MFSFRARPVVFMVLGLVLTGLLTWWWTRPDPRARLLREVEEMVLVANERGHTRLIDRLSPEARQMIADQFMQPGAALRWAAQIDSNQNRTYRVVNLAVFYPRDYAEVEFERSAPGREFNGNGIFPVPFIWRSGRWWVAGGFRGERDWNYPE
jgi:hypothetical protein